MIFPEPRLIELRFLKDLLLEQDQDCAVLSLAKVFSPVSTYPFDNLVCSTPCDPNRRPVVIVSVRKDG